jgi:hypothetical protein
MAKPSRPRLTKTFADAWFQQDGITAGEVRLMPDGEHRRYTMLESLILGMPLNSTDKNEAARIEPDTADHPFFESVWAGSTPLT